MTRFSVVIPTYNRGNLIERSLESVLAQEHPAHEIIVVDDCSTDETPVVLQPYVEKHGVRVIRHERNLERCRSRNTGMENATGDFVTFLDSDDVMYPQNLRDAAEFAQRNPQFQCFHSLLEAIDADGKVVYRFPVPSVRDRKLAITGGNFMGCIGVFIGKPIYQQYRFDPAINTSEDWEFWLRVLADYDVGQIPKVNNGFLQHGDRSVSRVRVDEVSARVEWVVNRVKGDPHLRAAYQDYLTHLEAGALLYLAAVANAAGEYRRGLQEIVRAGSRDARILRHPSYPRVLVRALAGSLTRRG